MSDTRRARLRVARDEPSTPTLAPVPPIDLAERPAEEVATQPRAARRPRWWRPSGVRADLLALLGYLTLAGYVTERLWRHPHTYILQTNGTDESQFEYYLWYAVRVVTQG